MTRGRRFSLENKRLNRDQELRIAFPSEMVDNDIFFCFDHCLSIIIIWPFRVTLRVKYCPNLKGLEDSFPDISVGKESACHAGDPGSIPGQEDQLEKG